MEATTYTAENPLIVTLPNSKWYRGHGSTESKLLREDGRQCCLGLACSALGVRSEDILDQGTIDASEALREAITGPLKALQNDLAQAHEGTGRVSETALIQAYKTNDDYDTGDLSDEARVAQLNTLVRPFGLRFVFDPNS